MRSFWIGAFALLAAGLVFAGEQCAVESGDTYVSQPDAGKLPPKGPLRIQKGKRYQVGDMRDGWISVQTGEKTVWARAAIFAYSCHPYGGSHSTQGTMPSKAAARGSRSSAASSSGGACPCGSGSVCVGPRGGRYCITSGGKKRYGG